MREKLIELLERAFDSFIDDPYCIPDEREFADHLIANGVTFAEDINVPSKWISVKDRLPSDNGKYLCHIFDSSLNNLSFMAMVYYDRGNFITQSSCVTDCVTHWMPLPDPPKGE